MQWLHIHIIPKKKKTGSFSEYRVKIVFFLKNIHFSYYSIFSDEEAILVQE